MSDEEYNLNRKVSDFFDEALGLGLADDIKSIEKNRYLPGSEIARGGMKSIEIAVDTVTGREVAKALLIGTDDPEKVERFFHEARICASLEHPNIVPVYDAGYDDAGKPFFTMRLLGGLTLQKNVKKSETSLANLLDIFVKVCDAVAYAHSQGIIHRDLKPDNIQIGDFGEVQVCDWGLACRDGYKKQTKKEEESTKEYVIPVTLDGMIKGTPGYLSPEQACSERAELSNTSDIYSLGAILYFILTQKSPLEGLDTITSIKRTISGDIPPIKDFAPETPNSLIAICKKAMEVSIEDRYSTVEDLKTDIVKYQHGFPTAAEDAGTWDSLKLFIKRNKRSAILVASFLVIFNTALIIFLINLSMKEKEARLAEADARKSAEQAKIAEAEAKESERETKETMAKLAISEQKSKKALEELIKVSKKAAPRYLRLGKMDKSSLLFLEGLKQIDHALILSPDNEDARTTKGKMLMALMRYDEAMTYFDEKSIVNGNLPKICQIMKDHMKGKETIDLEDILKAVKLYKEKNVGLLYQEELIYSPTLDFLNHEQRQTLAAKIFQLYNPEKNKSFEILKSLISKKMPHLLYRTGLRTFDVRKAKLKTFMIRGEETEKVLLPEEFNVNLTYKDLEACPNLKEVYVLKYKEEYKSFKKLNIKILTFKEFL